MQVLSLRVGALVAFVGTWMYMNGPGGVSPIILPRLADVTREVLHLTTSREIYSATLITLVEVAGAFVLAAGSGVAIGFWAARTERRAAVAEPLLVWAYLVPIVLFYPLFVLGLGIGMTSKIAYAAFGAFSPIAFNCLRGFRRISPEYVDIGRAYGATPSQMDWSIKFPAAVPLVTAGLQIGAALCMITVIVAEMLASTGGLGYLIRWYSQSFNTARTFAVILVVMAVAGLFQAIVKLVMTPRHS